MLQIGAVIFRQIKLALCHTKGENEQDLRNALRYYSTQYDTVRKAYRASSYI